MTGGVFKRLNSCATARAVHVMSTQSATGFEWSVKLFGTKYFYVGIASQLKSEYLNIQNIYGYDENAILYCSYNESPAIRIGKKVIFSKLSNSKTGDVIRFRFLPQWKKLLIDLVRIQRLHK